jgi:hypothetical protein
MPGPPGPGLKQVAVVNKQLVYGLDNDGALWSWNGSGWSRKACCVSQIAVGSDGDLWATNPPDQMRVLRWNGSQWAWSSIPTGMKQVTVANANTVYGLDNSGALFQWTGSNWQRKGCCVSQISVGSDGELWATNPPDQMRVLRWDGTQWTWNLPTGMKQVAVANASTIYALDNSGAMFRFKGGNWARQGCCVSHISVGSDGEVWATNPPDQMRVLRWQP